MLFLSDLTFNNRTELLCTPCPLRARGHLPRCRIQIPEEALHPLQGPFKLDLAPETCEPLGPSLESGTGRG